jgi:hypothetical protein
MGSVAVYALLEVAKRGVFIHLLRLHPARVRLPAYADP